MREHRIDLPLPREEALLAISEAAEMWGAQWWREGSGGRLQLPVVAGVRRGSIGGRIWTEPTQDGTRIILSVEDHQYKLNWPAVVVLLFGAIGGLVVALWPFYPTLLAFAPLAVILALAAWLLVASRLRTAGPEEFFEILDHASEADKERVPRSMDESQAIEP